MAEDRFVSEIASKVTKEVIPAFHTELLAFSERLSTNGAKGSVRVAPQLLRVEEAAIVLARTVKSIRQLIYRGELKVVRHGRAVRISIDEIVNFIARGRKRRARKLCSSNCKRKRGTQ